MKIYFLKYLFIGVLLFLINICFAQRIRKDHREMAPSEKSAYVNALIALRNSGYLAELSNHHSSHFNSPIHSISTYNGEFFLPWHRLFEFQMENAIRSITAVPGAANLCIPYWDWRVEGNVASVTWDDAGFLQLSALNTSSFTITRSFSNVTLASATTIFNLLTLPNLLPVPPAPGLKSSTANWFSYRTESWHDRGHNFIGGTMGSSGSPKDPVFFLHHGFIDKLWQEWYDSDNGVVKTPFTFSTPSSSYWMDWPGISPNSINDSRYLKFQENSSSPVTNEEVWYAYNRKLILDGANNTPFNITGTNRLYCYTAYTPWDGTVKGEIFIGDIKRDTLSATGVSADNRGGLKIKAGATCAFNAGSSVSFLPGFESEYGAVYETNIVELPCGFNTLTGEQNLIADADNIHKEEKNQLYVYAEPGSNNLTVNYNIPANSKVLIQLFNTMGQLVHTVNLGEQPAGYNLIYINMPLASGIYVCRLITESGEQSVKFAY